MSSPATYVDAHDIEPGDVAAVMRNVLHDPDPRTDPDALRLHNEARAEHDLKGLCVTCLMVRLTWFCTAGGMVRS